MHRVGQSHMHTVYIRYYWQRNHQRDGQVRLIPGLFSSGFGQKFGFANFNAFKRTLKMPFVSYEKFVELYAHLPKFPQKYPNFIRKVLTTWN